MTIGWILAAVAFLLALGFDLVPKMKEWWDPLPEMGKRWGWLVGCLVVPIVVWLAACYYPYLNLWGFEVGCDAPGFIDVLVVGFTAFLSYWTGQVGHAFGKAAGG